MYGRTSDLEKSWGHVTDGLADKRGTKKWVSGSVFMGSTRFPPGWRVEVLTTYVHTQYTRLNAHMLPRSYNT